MDVARDINSKGGSNLLSSLMLPDVSGLASLKRYPLTKLSGLKRWKLLAIDVFGDFFVLSEDKVYFVRTETSYIEETWDSYNSWLDAVVSNPDEVVGLEFMLAWVEENGALPDGHRLTPKIPFILGGSYEFNNIVASPISKIIDFRITLATQLADVPEGGRVAIEWKG